MNSAISALLYHRPNTVVRYFYYATAAVGLSLLFVLLVMFRLFIPALLLEYASLLGVAWLRPRLGILLLVIMLPLHTLAMTLLYALFPVSPSFVTEVAAWKEMMIVTLLASSFTLVFMAQRRYGARPRWIAQLSFLDWVAIGMMATLMFELLAPSVISLSQTHTTFMQRFYGFKIYAPLLICYGVGRFTLLDQRWMKRAIAVFMIVGAVTGVWGVIEYFTVPLTAYVTLGYVRYLHDVAHLTYTRYPSVNIPHPWWALPQDTSNLGLPENFSTSIGIYHIRRAVSTYLSSQVLAISYLVILPMCAPAWALFQRHRTWVALGAIAMTLGLLMTLTRGTILALVLAMTCIGVSVAWRHWRARRTDKRPPRVTQPLLSRVSRRTLVIVGAGTAVGALALVALSPILVPYITSAVTLRDYSVQEHIASWSQGLSFFKDSPWFGNGLGSIGVNDQRFTSAVRGPENEYLEIAAEGGLILSSLYILFLGGAIVGIWRRWTSAPAGWRRMFSLAVVIAVIAVAIDSISAPLLNTWVLADVLGLLIGLCMRPIVQSRENSVPLATPMATRHANSSPYGWEPLEAVGASSSGAPTRPIAVTGVSAWTTRKLRQ